MPAAGPLGREIFPLTPSQTRSTVSTQCRSIRKGIRGDAELVRQSTSDLRPAGSNPMKLEVSECTPKMGAPTGRGHQHPDPRDPCHPGDIPSPRRGRRLRLRRRQRRHPRRDRAGSLNPAGSTSPLAPSLVRRGTLHVPLQGQRKPKATYNRPGTPSRRKKADSY